MQNSATMPSQPQLGTPVPGTTGGLPALSGLSVTKNPMAQQLQSMGRGEDSMLIHMTPEEVNSLQGLAMAHGGSLTINPHTGLPEAGWLGKLLPTILGFAGAAFGLPTWALALGGTAAGTAATGNLGQGLMMGLQAYGGASLAGGLGVGEAGKKAAELAAKNAGTGVLNNAADTALTVTRTGAQQAAAAEAAIKGAQTAGSVATKAPGVFDKFTAFSKAGLPGGIIGKAAPYAAGMGLMSAASEATAPNLPKYKPEENKFNYVSMAPAKRDIRFQTPEQMRQSGGAEFQYITPNNPEPVPVSMLPLEEQEKYTYADGGMVNAPAGFEELVASYAANNPGAITASMYYPSTSSTPGTVSAAEKQYFQPKPATTPAPTPSQGGGLGSIDLSNIDLSGIDFSGINNWQSIIGGAGYTPSYIPDNSYTPPSFVQPEMLDTSGNMQSLPTQQPIYTANDYKTPDYEPPMYTTPVQQAPIYEAPSYTPPSFMQPDTLDIFGGAQSLPTQQPIYSAPAYEEQVYSPPVYEPQPIYSAPVYEPQPIYSAPVYDPQAYSPPVYETTPYKQLYDFYSETGDNNSISSNDVSPENVNFFARGGGVNMRDGAFVVDARTVSELGNGSSNAGMELLARMGGKPVRGPGDGVSDSVPASIGGKQKARVARDEVIFQPDAVRRLGGGSEKRGTQKLYAMMDKAHKARKKAKRGQDTGLRKGLA